MDFKANLQRECSLKMKRSLGSRGKIIDGDPTNLPSIC